MDGNEIFMCVTAYNDSSLLSVVSQLLVLPPLHQLNKCLLVPLSEWAGALHQKEELQSLAIQLSTPVVVLHHLLNLRLWLQLSLVWISLTSSMMIVSTPLLWRLTLNTFLECLMKWMWNYFVSSWYTETLASVLACNNSPHISMATAGCIIMSFTLLESWSTAIPKMLFYICP